VLLPSTAVHDRRLLRIREERSRDAGAEGGGGPGAGVVNRRLPMLAKPIARGDEDMALTNDTDIIAPTW
jgi:hypothetical protein